MNAHFIEHVDEQFGRLIVRSKDIEKVVHGVVDTTKERVHVVRLFLILDLFYLSAYTEHEATRIRKSARWYRPQRHDPRKR